MDNAKSAWIGACAIGEGVGIAAGATASVLASRASGPAAAALLLAGAGLVEGGTLGTLQWLVLRRKLPRLSPLAWIVALVLVGAGGWLGSLPATLAPDDGGSGPAWWVSTLGGAALGALAGTILGAVQALVLRRHAGRRLGWLLASIGGWAALFAVVMTAAGSIPAGQPVIVVTLAGAGAGLVGGALMGVITLPALTRLDASAAARQPWFNSVVLALLRTPVVCRLLNGSLAELSYESRRGPIAFPAAYRVKGDLALVVVGWPERKQWWRHFRRGVRPVSIRMRTGLRHGMGTLVTPKAPEWDRALSVLGQNTAMMSGMALLIDLAPSGLVADR